MRKVLHSSSMSEVGHPARSSWSTRPKPILIESSCEGSVVATAAASGGPLVVAFFRAQWTEVRFTPLRRSTAALREEATHLPTHDGFSYVEGRGQVARNVAEDQDEHKLKRDLVSDVVQSLLQPLFVNAT